MIRIIACIIFLTISAIAVANVELERASVDYKQNLSFNSLSKIVEHLVVGMKKSDVDQLLGEADYSPTDGLYYYSSDKRESSEISGRRAIVGLIVDYRNCKSQVTDELQNFKLGIINE